MAERGFDIETLVENAVSGVLATQPTTSAYTIKIWDDNKDLELNPVVRVKATLVDEIDGVFNTYLASNVVVDLGVFTTKKRDNTGRTGNAIRGELRRVIGDTSIVSLLSGQVSGLFVYNNGVIPQESFEVADDKIYQKGISVLVVCTTIDI